MSDRFTVQLDDDNANWVEQEAERRDRSKAWIINESLRLARGENTILVNDSEVNTGEVRTGEVNTAEKQRLDELEERIAELEARIDASPMAHDRYAREEHGQAADGAVSDDPSDVGNQNPSERALSGSEQSGSEVPSSDEVWEILKDIDVPGRRAATQRNRRKVALWAWEYLRDNDDGSGVETQEIANSTYGAFWDESIGYSVSSRYPAYNLWDNCLREVLKKLPCIDAAPETGNEWRFRC